MSLPDRYYADLLRPVISGRKWIAAGGVLVGCGRTATDLEELGAPPPFLLAHGTEDFPHLMTQAEEMETALADAGGDVERVALEGRDHFSASYAGGEADGPWVPLALSWMASR